MTRQDAVDALVAERFGAPVREYRPKTRPRPIADQLTDLLLEQQASVLTVVEAS